MESRKEAAAIPLDVKPTDRIAQFGLTGVLLCFLTWGLLALVDSVFGQAPSFRAALLAPTAYQTFVRLSVVSLVVAGTLVLQLLAKRHFEAEARIGAEHERLYQMYAHSPESILCLDRNLEIVYANPAAETFVAGIELSGTLIGRNCCDVFWSEGQANGCLGEEVPLPAGEAGKLLGGVMKPLAYRP